MAAAWQLVWQYCNTLFFSACQKSWGPGWMVLHPCNTVKFRKVIISSGSRYFCWISVPSSHGHCKLMGFAVSPGTEIKDKKLEGVCDRLLQPELSLVTQSTYAMDAAMSSSPAALTALAARF